MNEELLPAQPGSDRGLCSICPPIASVSLTCATLECGYESHFLLLTYFHPSSGAPSVSSVTRTALRSKAAAPSDSRSLPVRGFWNLIDTAE